MRESRSTAKGSSPKLHPAIRSLVFSSSVALILGIGLFASPQNPPQATAQTAPSRTIPLPDCPVQVLRFYPNQDGQLLSGGMSARIKNASGKTIDGLVFNAAFADAAEHWKWLHWDFDDGRPVQEFGWNKQIKPDQEKTLSWDGVNFYLRHGGGVALVLTSVLFEDGSSWDETSDGASCKYVWHNSNKKSFVKPIDLPAR